MASSTLASVSATRAVLERYGLFTKKSFGQHFLVNDHIVDRICALADVQAHDHILEVGPGIGTLTVALLGEGARVVAIEADTNLLAVLNETCEPYAERLTVIGADALDVMPDNVPFAPTKFVANLPYAVAATLVLTAFERFTSLEQATVMVQAEVAARMAAKPSTKDYGAYTVKLALYAQPAGHFGVGPGNFFPPPRVDSTVIRLNRACHTDLTNTQRQAAAIMADAAFTNRRKTLANSCKTFFASQPRVLDALPRMFETCGIDPSCRGETLNLDDFKALGRAYSSICEQG